LSQYFCTDLNSGEEKSRYKGDAKDVIVQKVVASLDWLQKFASQKDALELGSCKEKRYVVTFKNEMI